MQAVSFGYTVNRSDYQKPIRYWISRSTKWRVYFAACGIGFVTGMIWGNWKVNLDPDFQSTWNTLAMLMSLAFVVLVLIPPCTMLGLGESKFEQATKDGNRFTITIDAEGYTAETEFVIKKIKWGRLSRIEETAETFLFLGPKNMRFGLTKRHLPKETIAQIKEVLASAPVTKRELAG